QRGYDLVADKFDQSVFRTPACIVDAIEEQLKLRAPFAQGLDVGCGTGALSQVLTRVCTHRVVGLDSSEGMLAKARLACPPLDPAQRVEFWQGDILKLEGRGQFDVCTCFGMFGHLEAADHPEMLRRIRSSLRPGGQFIFVLSHFKRRWTRPLFWFALVFDFLMKLRNLLFKPEFVMYYLSFPLTRARRLLEEIGYRVEIVDDVFPAPYSQLKLIVATRI
ncbi:unnamed protein product, partial [Phaeothamnion confervicola]